jgi:hypothetical protein
MDSYSHADRVKMLENDCKLLYEERVSLENKLDQYIADHGYADSWTEDYLRLIKMAISKTTFDLSQLRQINRIMYPTDPFKKV